VSDLTGPVGGQTLRVVPSHRWLTAPERGLPVTIDPTITKTTNDYTYVQSNILNTVVSGENEMKSGTYDGGATTARSLMKFADVPTQPGRLTNTEEPPRVRRSLDPPERFTAAFDSLGARGCRPANPAPRDAGAAATPHSRRRSPGARRRPGRA
jgi:hypothetical protein